VAYKETRQNTSVYYCRWTSHQFAVILLTHRAVRLIFSCFIFFIFIDSISISSTSEIVSYSEIIIFRNREIELAATECTHLLLQVYLKRHGFFFSLKNRNIELAVIFYYVNKREPMFVWKCNKNADQFVWIGFAQLPSVWYNNNMTMIVNMDLRIFINILSITHAVVVFENLQSNASENNNWPNFG
jgi:hypothetical protein